MPLSPSRPSRPWEVAAYYFPGFHRDRRTDSWHHPGWTEWELLAAARPHFPGHNQPVVPAWGYFDEADPAWAARQIDLAADHGITSFLFDWYWYEDGPFLQGALEEGFLGAPNRHRLRYALMWANHDWLDLHPAPPGPPYRRLLEGAISEEAFDAMVDHVVTRHFSQPGYLRLEGEPYFSIYELGTLVSGLGGMDGAAGALERFRAAARSAGWPGIHLNAVVWGLRVLPGEARSVDAEEAVHRLGVSSVGSYTWLHHAPLPTFPRSSYTELAERNYGVWEEQRRRFSVPYHPNVSVGWDPSPRANQDLPFEPGPYPWTPVVYGNSPDAVRAALERARAFVDTCPETGRLVTINAWNEWTEGSYLLPDTVRGTAHLEAIRAVFGPPPT